MSNQGPREPRRGSRPLRAGDLVDGRYELVKRLSEGRAHAVWRVRHRLLGRHFALKVLYLGTEREKEFSERFRREARALSALEHPNVVALTDFGHLEDGAPFFAMDFVEGEGLDQLIARRGRLELGLAIDVAICVGRALSAAHGAGIVHRDLKPSNVRVGWVGGRCRVKVLDFGFARAASDGPLTQPEVSTGTPEYMSPEQARGERVGARSDVYALGVLLYEMLMGQPPFTGGSYVVLANRHLRSPVPAMQGIVGRPEAVEAVAAAVRRCLEKQPERRFASALEALEALERARQSMAPVEVPRARRSVTARWTVVGSALGAVAFSVFRWISQYGLGE